MAGQLRIRDECKHGVGVDAHARRIGYRATLGGRVTPTLLAPDNSGRESPRLGMSVGNGVDWIALPEWTLTVQTGMLGSGPADCVAGKGLGGGRFNDGALLGIWIGIGTWIWMWIAVHS